MSNIQQRSRSRICPNPGRASYQPRPLPSAAPPHVDCVPVHGEARRLAAQHAAHHRPRVDAHADLHRLALRVLDVPAGGGGVGRGWQVARGHVGRAVDRWPEPYAAQHKPGNHRQQGGGTWHHADLCRSCEVYSARNATSCVTCHTLSHSQLCACNLRAIPTSLPSPLFTGCYYLHSYRTRAILAKEETRSALTTTPVFQSHLAMSCMRMAKSMTTST